MGGPSGTRRPRPGEPPRNGSARVGLPRTGSRPEPRALGYTQRPGQPGALPHAIHPPDTPLGQARRRAPLPAAPGTAPPRWRPPPLPPQHSAERTNCACATPSPSPLGLNPHESFRPSPAPRPGAERRPARACPRRPGRPPGGGAVGAPCRSPRRCAPGVCRYACATGGGAARPRVRVAPSALRALAAPTAPVRKPGVSGGRCRLCPPGFGVVFSLSINPGACPAEEEGQGGRRARWGPVALAGLGPRVPPAPRRGFAPAAAPAKAAGTTSNPAGLGFGREGRQGRGEGGKRRREGVRPGTGKGRGRYSGCAGGAVTLPGCLSHRPSPLVCGFSPVFLGLVCTRLLRF